jgi:hypothetical protein
MFGPKIKVGFYILEKSIQKFGLSLTKFDHVFGAPMDQGLTLVILLIVASFELFISSYSDLMTKST